LNFKTCFNGFLSILSQLTAFENIALILLSSEFIDDGLIF
jgi:hypothetical protein